MTIDAKIIKQLRDKTGISVMECKRALEQTEGDLERAAGLLRERSIELARKKSGRSAKEGAIGAYVHTGGKIGVLVELNVETDFVARNEQFQALLKDLCLQVAASAPRFTSREEIPEDLLEVKRKEYGEIEPFIEEACLLEQAFIKDPGRKIREVIEEAISRFGENITVKRFTRFEMGKYESDAP